MVINLAFALLFLDPLVWLLKRTLHMYQLNSYQALSYSHWLRDNKSELLAPGRLLPLALMGFGGGLRNPLAALVCMTAGAALFRCANRAKPAKKPLVFTARVKRQTVTAAILTALPAIFLSAMSRPALTVGLAFWTALTPVWVLAVGLINKPVESAIADWYRRDAARILKSNPGLRIIGITGSYGKTSTKFFLKELLSVKYNTYMTPGNFNTTLGVIRAVREGLLPTHEIFLCEMGARHLGDVKDICDLVEPETGVLTYIGQQHMETFGSQENIIKAKRELSDAVHKKGGTVFVNNGSAILAQQRFSGDTVRCGMEEGCGYRAGEITIGPEGCSFTVTTPDGQTGTFRTRLLGRANVENLTLAIAVAHQMGVPLKAMEPPVRMLKPVPHRLELVPGPEITYIDDAYNSNPAGAAVALETLGLCRGIRVLVTPGLVELGDIEQEENKKIGLRAAENCDWAILVDPRRGPDIKSGLLEAGFPHDRIIETADLNQGLAALRQIAPGMEKTALLLNDLTDNY